VVLLTDGRPKRAGDPGRGVDRLAARGIPIYPVLIGSTVAPKDVAIAAVKAPESVLKGDIASVVVTVKADGVAGVDIPVTLERPGGRALKQVVLGPADGLAPGRDVSCTHGRAGPSRPGGQGRSRCLAMPGPTTTAGALTIQVADDKARVLLVDGEARWGVPLSVQRAEARPARDRRGRCLSSAPVQRQASTHTRMLSLCPLEPA